MQVGDKTNLVNLGLILNGILKDAEIKILNLIDLGVTDRTLDVFSKMLSEEDTLKELNLSSNKLGDEGMKHLAEILGNNPSIQKCYVGFNSITNVGAEILLNSLQNNTKLEVLSVDGNNISDASLFLDKNNLTHIYVQGNQVTTLNGTPNLPGASWVDFSDNKITYVSPEVQDYANSHHTVFDLRDNSGLTGVSTEYVLFE